MYNGMSLLGIIRAFLLRILHTYVHQSIRSLPVETKWNEFLIIKYSGASVYVRNSFRQVVRKPKLIFP